MSPNLLARTIETVEGGGLVVILLRSMASLRQLCTMTMVCLYIEKQPRNILIIFQRIYT